MTTTKKWVFLRCVLALILVLNVFLPAVPAYAEGESESESTPFSKEEFSSEESSFTESSSEESVSMEGTTGSADVTAYLTDVESLVTQENVEIPENGTLSNTKPIKVKISFGVPVVGDDPTPANPVHKGDTASFALSNAFQLTTTSSIVLKKGEVIVGHVSFSTDPVTKMVTANVVFDGDDSIFVEGTDHVSCDFTAEFEYDGTGSAGDAGDHIVEILSKSYTVTVPPEEILYDVVKSGAVNYTNRCIDWSVEVSATQGGEDVGLAGYRFVDDLTNVGAYVENSFKVEDEAAAVSYENNTLVYEFPAETESPVTVTFRTALTDAALYATTEQKVTNTAALQDADENELDSGSFEVKFTPKWIEKGGTASDTPGSAAYDPTGRTITWTVTVNHMEASLTNAVITDAMPNGLTFDSATVQAWTGTAWGAAVPITPAGNKFSLGNISTKMLLTIVTKVTDEAYTAKVTNFANTASFTWDGGPATGPSATKTVGIGYNPISKSGLADALNQQIHWTVKVDTKGQTIPDLTVYDLLVYGGSALSLGTVTGIPAGISTSDLTQRYNQKYEDGSFAGGSLQITVYPIEQNGVRVADLLKITGFAMDAVNTFHFDTIILNPSIFAGNSTTSVSNTATLFSANTKLNAATGSVNYASKMLVKRMLTRTAASDPAAGVNSGITNDMSLGFNYDEKSVVFRIGVNANGMDLNNAINAAGQTLGTATVTDTLPAGWEFTEIAPDVDYLIFEGTGNADGTVTASDATPDTVAGLTADIAGGTAAFTFTALNHPYVILVKARLTAATAAAYFGENAIWTDTNSVSLKTANWTAGVGSSQSVRIVSTILEKDTTCPQTGELLWTVDYKPYELTQPGTKLKDTLPVGIDVRTDAFGNLILEGNITASELTLNIDGSYTPGASVTLTEGNNIDYDPILRTLSFIIPDSAKAYRLTYLTDITGEPGEVSNEVALIGADSEQESTGKPYVILEEDGAATFQRNGWIRITKTDESNEPLAGARFTLYASDGETVVKTDVTGADGVLKFKVIPDGEYVLRETEAPEGYVLSAKAHTLTVTTVGGVVTSSIDGKTGSASNTLEVQNFLEGTVGNLTITKSVAGNRADKEKTFNFTVTFEGAEGTYEYLGSGIPDGTIQSGDTISLAHGQSITILSLPKDTAYTVTEADYRSEGYRTTSEGAEGVITADETQTASFTNTKNRVEDDDKKPVEKGTLTITKTVNGDLGDRDRLFTFVVSFDTDDAFRYSGSKSGTIEDGGTIQLKHGESVTIRGIPAGTVYKVVEKEAGKDGYATSASGASGKITGSGKTAAFVNEKESIPNTSDESGDSRWIVGLAGSLLIFLGAVGLSLTFKKKKDKK